MSNKPVTGHENITRAALAIHNPADPRHFMRVKPWNGRVAARFDGELLAETDRALLLLEISRDFYDPVFYFPQSSVLKTLIPSQKATHCPLKGHTTYLNFGSEADIAWSYTETYPFADLIKDYVAFDASRVGIEIAPTGG